MGQRVKKTGRHDRETGIGGNQNFVVRDEVLVTYRGSRRNVTIPGNLGITAIRNHAFSCYEGLESIAMPAGVISIGEEAFRGCTNLQSVTIPAGVTAIEHCAFADCTGLQSITIPGSVTVINYTVFSGCTNLSTITVDAENPHFTAVDGVLFDKHKSRILCCPVGKEGAEYFIPNNVTAIGDCAFLYCINLQSIIIPNGVTGIAFGAFCKCTSLRSITMPDSVTVIEKRAFKDCKSLKTVCLSRKTCVDKTAFEGTLAEFFYTD
ncbi:MAG: leucine-rich repeat domain-containing protein [Treponema sp.]|nr:leucine-rich repeat domain-containing protein [Treponema sp.]